MINQAIDVSIADEKSNTLVRFVDDIFCIFPNQNTLEIFFHTIAHLHPNIKFTEETKQDNQLAYLDVLVKLRAVSRKIFRRGFGYEYSLPILQNF